MADWLKIVAKHHKEYVKTVRGWGEQEYAEDLVQEMYLRLYNYTTPEKIIKNGKVNRGFIWFTLRNMYLTLCGQRSRNEKIRIGEGFEILDETEDYKRFEALEIIDSMISDEVNSFHWYDKKLFQLYMTTDMSMRDISKETNISLSSIFITIQKCKGKIKQSVGENMEDLRNEDYEYIK
jgi:RNA polymerase sigma factor (sigma-70 family)